MIHTHADFDGLDMRAFKKARRHSAFVRILRIALPVCGLVVLAGIGMAFLWSQTGSISFDVGSVSMKDGQMVMNHPELKGFDQKRRPYNMTAQKAFQDPKSPKKIQLNQINAQLPVTQTSFAKVTAGNGFLDGDAKTLKLTDSITISTEDGISAQLEEAFIDIGRGELNSSHPVYFKSGQAEISAGQFSVRQNGAELLFEDKVKMVIHPQALNGN